MPARDADPVDALYAAPPDGFVAARDALAKALRDDGDRAAAARVRALRKPTRAAWAVNVAVRERPQAARELADAAQRLHDAQRDVLAGGDVALLHEADARARAAADALAAAAPATDAPTAEKIHATLRAAAVDADVLAEVVGGRLAREQVASGFGGLAGMASAPPARPAPKPAREQERVADEEQERAAREAEKRAAREAEEQAAREAERRERLRRAQEAEASAEAAAAAARDALDEAEARVADRRAELRAAEDRLAAAQRARAEADGDAEE